MDAGFSINFSSATGSHLLLDRLLGLLFGFGKEIEIELSILLQINQKVRDIVPGWHTGF